MPNAPIAITGATGFLGQSLLDTALSQGLTIRALTRKPQPERPHVTWIHGDLANRAALTELCTGAQAVIHVAGLVNTPNPAEFTAANVAGTAHVIEAMQAAHTRQNRRPGLDPGSRSPRLIFVSSLSAREPALSAYGASKAQAERLVMASPLNWTIVRPPTIYGPRDTDLFELFRAAKWGIIPVPSQGRSSIIHADDLSELLLALIPASAQVTHRIFEPDDGKPHGWTHDELAQAIGAAMNRRPFILHLSPKLMHWAARTDLRLRGPNAKLTLDRVGYMTHPDWVVTPNASIPPALWQSRIPTPAGLKTTAQWYRANRWL